MSILQWEEIFKYPRSQMADSLGSQLQ